MDALNELPVSGTENASGCAASPGLGMIEEAGGVCGEEGFEEREVAEEEKRRRLELKAIDNEVHNSVLLLSLWLEIESDACDTGARCCTDNRRKGSAACAAAHDAAAVRALIPNIDAPFPY